MLPDTSIPWPDLALLLTGALLYAEMHYRWWPLPSRYFRREPEILADAPRRVEPDRPLPLLLLVKDAHRYPIRLERVLVEQQAGGERQRIQEITFDEDIAAHWWHRSIQLERPAPTGEVTLWVTFHYTIRGKRRSCTTHNLRSLKPRPLHIHLAGETLPGEDVIWGDLHHHSAYTEDIIEFGAPLEATQQAATAAGLGFVGITDHSYDLDDLPDNWRTTDPQLGKWHASRREIAALNGRGDGTLLLPGEEVTVRNSRGRNVHALVLNHPEFLPGSGDSGERPLRTRSELDLPGLAERLSPDSIALAAHPYHRFPFIQRLLIGRGRWQDRDAQHSAIDGLQILNGRLDAVFSRSVAEWTRLLLQGHRKFVYAGSDAHGNFNQYRQIRTPFVSLEERRTYFLGACRTGVLGAVPGNLPSIMATLKAGRCLISTGPFLDMRLTSGEQTARLGETIQGRKVKVSLDMASTAEFGPLANFRLLRGRVGQAREEVLTEAPIEGDRYRSHWEAAFELQPGTTYFRAEVEACLEGTTNGLAMTNPVWVES